MFYIHVYIKLMLNLKDSNDSNLNWKHIENNKVLRNTVNISSKVLISDSKIDKRTKNNYNKMNKNDE